VTRDRLISYVRAAGSIALGAGILYMLGRWLGWRVVGAIVIVAVADLSRWPANWRPW